MSTVADQVSQSSSQGVVIMTIVVLPVSGMVIAISLVASDEKRSFHEEQGVADLIVDFQQKQVHRGASNDSKEYCCLFRC